MEEVARLVAEELFGIGDVLELAPVPPFPREGTQRERLPGPRFARQEKELAAPGGFEIVE